MATIVLVSAVVAVLFAAVATSGDVQYVDGAPSFARDPTPNEPPITVVPVEPEIVELDARPPLEVPGFVIVILQTLMIVCVAALAALALAYAWQHRPRLRWRRRARAAEFDVLDEVAAAIAADAAAQYAALRHGAPRNAIVECWLRLETSVVDAGVQRHPADTSEELTRRVLARFAVDQHAIADLASLYREARFSTHDMGEEARHAAIRALDEVHDGIGVSR